MTTLIRLQESMHRGPVGSGAVGLRPTWPGVLGESFAWELG
jgi:hypothetical protein